MEIAIVAIVFGSMVAIVNSILRYLSNRNKNKPDDDIVRELHNIIVKLEQRVDVLESLLDKKN